MRLFLSELRKLIGNVKMLLIIIAIVLINSVFLIVSEIDEYSPAAYDQLWDTLNELPLSERADFVSERIADYDDPKWLSGTVECEFADSFSAEQELMRDVYDEVKQADEYPDYLKKVDEAAENMKAAAFFSDENSFDYRNVIKTQEEFSRLSADNVVSDRSKGVLMAVKFGVPDILMLFLTMIFAEKLLLSERERGYFRLIGSTYKGGARLGGAKLFSFIAAQSISALLLYGGGIITGAAMYGLGDLSRGVQSVYGFLSCGSVIDTGTFLLGFMLIKLLFCAALAAVVFLLSALPLESAAAYTAIIAFIGIEAVLYYTVSATDVLSFLHQINIVSVADSAELIGKYLNINIFGQPINGAAITCGATAVFAIACGAAGIKVFSWKISEKRKDAKKGILPDSVTSLAANEAYKTFAAGKGLFILIAAALAALILQKPVKPYYKNLSDYIYYSYIAEIQGEYTEEKAQYIQSELESSYAGFTERDMAKREALQELSQHAEYLKESGGYFLNDVGYQMLTGGGSVYVYDRIAAAVKAFVLILIAAYSYTSEHRFGGIVLLRSSPGGGMRTFFTKLLSVVICSLLILAIFDGLRIYNVLNVWGTPLPDAPALSMEHLSGVSMPIWLYITLTELGRLVGMTLTGAAVFLLSSYAKNYSAAVMASVALFVAPPVLSILGLEFMDFFLFEPFLIGNVIH